MRRRNGFTLPCQCGNNHPGSGPSHNSPGLPTRDGLTSWSLSPSIYSTWTALRRGPSVARAQGSPAIAVQGAATWRDVQQPCRRRWPGSRKHICRMKLECTISKRAYGWGGPKLPCGQVRGPQFEGRAMPSEKYHLSRACWRRGWDSNPRYACTHNGFRDRPDRPLWHLSRGPLIGGAIRAGNTAAGRWKIKAFRR